MTDTIGTSALKRDQHFTLDDWRDWPEGERWELIDGTAWNMCAAPRVPHQRKTLDLAHCLVTFLDGKPCQPFIAPVDVFLSAADLKDSVVEPDVFVVCDPDKVADDGIHGAPDFVAEVLSETTAYKDLGVKKELYERAGVREYWVIHPGTRSVQVFVRGGKGFAPAREYLAGNAVPSASLPGFSWTCP